METIALGSEPINIKYKKRPETSLLSFFNLYL